MCFTKGVIIQMDVRSGRCFALAGYGMLLEIQASYRILFLSGAPCYSGIETNRRGRFSMLHKAVCLIFRKRWMFVLFCLLSGVFCLSQGNRAAGKVVQGSGKEGRKQFRMERENPMTEGEYPQESMEPMPERTPELSPEPTPDITEEPVPTASMEPIPSSQPTKKPAHTATPKPFRLQLKQNNTRIRLRWKKVSGAVSYRVYRGQAGKSFKPYQRTKKKTIQVKYASGKSYKLKVVAYNKQRKAIRTSLVYHFYIPKQPSRFHIVYQNPNSAQMTWNRVPRADYYLVYQKTGKGSEKLIRQTKRCEFTNHRVSSGNTYQFRVRAVFRAGKQRFIGKPAKQSYDNHQIVASDHQKYSYSEMVSDIVRLSGKYPGIIHYSVIGKSEDGRNLYEVTVGNRHASRSLLVVSTLHAREYMASLLCMSQIEYYARNYREVIGTKKVSDVLNRICIRYLPMANPDGVTISQEGITGIHSKKLRKRLKKISKGENLTVWKANAKGVDLNRNFPYQFEVSGKAGSQGYSGANPVNSKEAAAIDRRIRALKGSQLKGVIHYHAMGSVIYGSSQHAGSASAAAGTQRMYQTAREITGYTSAGNGRSGGLREYIMCTLQLPSITLEIGRHTCPGPISEFSAIWKANANLVLWEAALFQ